MKNMHDDLTVAISDKAVLNIRVGAIIMKNNKFLMVKNDRAEYLYSVGGRIQMGETAEDAVKREVYEETGVKLDIDRLGFIHENYFIGDAGKILGKWVYEISFFFYMNTPDDFRLVCDSFAEEGEKENLVWVSADTSKKFFPEFFKTELAAPCKEIKHIVTREPLTRKAADSILENGFCHNPGPWKEHSRWVGYSAAKIASVCGLNSDDAYCYGVLHDIGRRFGVTNLAHIYDGYHYLMEMGFENAAKIALTHSFNRFEIKDYIGKFDLEDSQIAELKDLLANVQPDDYDYLIQLCDSIATAEGIVSMEERMLDVKKRYGYYPREKWERNMELKKYFENKAGMLLEQIFEEDLGNASPAD